tara:strand:- start:39 stop:536 length:498 start_codon:yes stop_codon:yes gene_type:complete
MKSELHQKITNHLRDRAESLEEVCQWVVVDKGEDWIVRLVPKNWIPESRIPLRSSSGYPLVFVAIHLYEDADPPKLRFVASGEDTKEGELKGDLQRLPGMRKRKKLSNIHALMIETLPRIDENRSSSQSANSVWPVFVNFYENLERQGIIRKVAEVLRAHAYLES